MHLLDSVALHVEQARAASAARVAPLASTVVGDARELPFADASVDVVLMLGPLYHLTEASDRARALAEARRALRPGGLLAAAAITRFASTLDGVAQGFLLSPASRRSSSATSPTASTATPARIRPGSPRPTSTVPTQLEREVAAAGFEVRALLAIEGAVGAAAETHALDPWLDDPAGREVLLRAIRRVEAEPSLLGASPHVLAVATRP